MEERKEEQSGFDESIDITRFLMRVHGIWPGYCTSKYKILHYAFLFATIMVFFFINVPQSIQVFHLNGDFNAILNVLMLADVPISITFVKLICVGYYWPVLNQLILLMHEDWYQTKGKHDLDIMHQKAKVIRQVSLVFMILSESTGVLCTSHRSYDLYSAIKIDSNGTKPMYMSGRFPYDVQKSPNFEITWMCQLLANHLSIGSFAAIDSLFVTFVLHLCGQLNILRDAFMTLGQMDPLDDRIFLNRLGELARKHEKINQFIDVLDTSFNLMFLYQIFCFTIVMCLQGYYFILTEQDMIELAFMIYYTIWFSMTLFIYCFVAELLNDENSFLEHAVFYCGWFNLPAKDTRLLIVPLGRLKKPLELTAGGICVFSLELFTNVVKTAGGYVSVLVAMRRKLDE